MKLYSRPLSPFAARCRIQLYAKGLPFELVPVPMPNPEAFRRLNPIGKVPALEIGGEVIPESQVICEYLEARFPEPPRPRARSDGESGRGACLLALAGLLGARECGLTRDLLTD